MKTENQIVFDKREEGASPTVCRLAQGVAAEVAEEVDAQTKEPPHRQQCRGSTGALFYLPVIAEAGSASKVEVTAVIPAFDANPVVMVAMPNTLYAIVPVTTVIARKAEPEPTTESRGHGALVEFFAVHKVVDGDGGHAGFLCNFALC